VLLVFVDEGAMPCMITSFTYYRTDGGAFPMTCFLEAGLVEGSGWTALVDEVRVNTAR
jgi:hypothetical protein